MQRSQRFPRQLTFLAVLHRDHAVAVGEVIERFKGAVAVLVVEIFTHAS